MAEFFGILERIAADLYPWRWPILAAILVIGAAATYYAYKRQLHLAVWRRRRLAAIYRDSVADSVRIPGLGPGIAAVYQRDS